MNFFTTAYYIISKGYQPYENHSTTLNYNPYQDRENQGLHCISFGHCADSIIGNHTHQELWSPWCCVLLRKFTKRQGDIERIKPSPNRISIGIHIGKAFSKNPSFAISIANLYTDLRYFPPYHYANLSFYLSLNELCFIHSRPPCWSRKNFSRT